MVFPDNTEIPLKKNHLEIYEAAIPKRYNGQTVRLKVRGLRPDKNQFSDQYTYVLPDYPAIKQVATNPKPPIATKQNEKPSKPQTQEKSPPESSEHDNSHNASNENSETVEDKEKKQDEIAEQAKKKKRKRKKRKHKTKRMIASVDWGIVTIGVLSANACLFGLGFFFYLRRKRKSNAVLDDIDLDNGDKL